MSKPTVQNCEPKHNVDMWNTNKQSCIRNEDYKYYKPNCEHSRLQDLTQHNILKPYKVKVWYLEKKFPVAQKRF